MLLIDTRAEEPAAFVRAAVQVLDELPPNVEGVQLSDDNAAGENRLSVLVRETPSAVAVTMAVWSALTWAAVAEKLADVCPEAMVTLAGTLRLPLLLLRETANPAAGAPEVRETEQDVLPGVLIEAVEQLNALRAATGEGSVIEPEVPVAGIEVPFGSEATTPVS